MSTPDDHKAAPTYRVLTQPQIEAINSAVFRILEGTGVRVSHPEGLELLRSRGCQVRGDDGDIALIPAGLVRECLATAPSTVVIYDRQGAEAMRLGDRRNYYGLGTDLINTQDLETGRRRTSCLQDVVNAARVSQACKNIDFIASFALPREVPVNAMYMICVKTQMEHSTKPIFFTAAGKEDLEYIVQMASVVAGGEDALRAKPFLINYSEPTPPLTHSFGAVAKLFVCADHGIPVCYTPAAMLGASTPVTLAGALVQTIAEALSGLVLHQLRAPGAPIISGVALPPLDMRTSCVSYSAPEMRLGNSAFADLFHSYGLPIWSSAGSDAQILDAQGAWENAMGIMLASLDGANLIHDVAYLGQGLLGDPASIVLCDEIVGYVKRMVRGFEVTPEALAVEAIERTGPGGNYLTDDHTLKNFRDALWHPLLANRDNLDGWMAKGATRLEERARDRALQILADPKPPILSAEVQARLDALAAQAEADLAHIQFVA